MTMWLSFQVSNLVNRHHLLWRLWSVPFKQGKSNEGKKVVTVSVEIEVSSNTGNSRCFRYEAQMQTRTTTRVDAIELAENGSKCPFFHLLVVLSSSPPPSCASKRTRQQDCTQPCAVTVSGAQFSHDPLDVCVLMCVCVSVHAAVCGWARMSPVRCYWLSRVTWSAASRREYESSVFNSPPWERLEECKKPQDREME